MAETNPFDQQKPIPGVRYIVAVSSGKGGVGKSTVSTNLAVATAKHGKKVGLLDADIYGPSLPRMLGALNQTPPIDENQKVQPLKRFGIQVMSMGLLVEEDLAVVWRGPMLFKAMNQFFNDVAWDDLDVLYIDLPPGTGDVQLSMVQKVPVSGAITVTTPQNVALADVKKSMDMFERVKVPLWGVVENMSYMPHPDDPGKKIQVFPKGDLNAFLDQKKVPKLGEVPLEPAVAMACEAGIPIVESQPQSLAAQEFMNIAKVICDQI